MNPDASWPSAPGGESISPPLSTADLCAIAGEGRRIGPLPSAIEYYVPRWVDLLSGGAKNAGFNWAAAAFGSNWCFWRKLYGLAFVILIAEFVSSALVGSILIEGFDWERSPETLGPAAWLALLPVRALLGHHANTLYLGKAIRVVAAARLRHPHAAEQRAFLAKHGGTSWLVLGIALAVQLLAMFGPSLGAG